MRNNSSIKIGLLLLMTILFIVSALAPMVIGYNAHIHKTIDGEVAKNVDDDFTFYRFDRYHFPESYSSEKRNLGIQSDDVISGTLTVPKETTESTLIKTEQEEPLSSPVTSAGGPMDSPWPMYCHDVRHTGQSPYSTTDNPGHNKWWFRVGSFIHGSSVIDDNGTIYFGSWGNTIYALYLNGTLKWTYDIGGNVESSPAIDKDGVIYIGIESLGSKYLDAVNPNGTRRWRYGTGGEDVWSSPAIGEDGTIYFGSAHEYPEYGHIHAVFPNGTIRWKYQTNHVVYSSPAIGEDGTVYCGSHDSNLYALCPNNGTLKWKFDTGGWIRTSPCIADDGTIHVVSLDNYLYAVYPNGTLKWKTDVGAGTSPTIGHDGTIYAGYTELHAVNPTNGSVKWIFDVDGTIRGGTPCNSVDGTIYLGTSDGGKFIAVNPDGTERWNESIGNCEFAPSIGKDGTIYIGGIRDNKGYLHAFGELDPDAPTAPDIDGPTSGKAGSEYEYTFKSTSPLSNDLYYRIEWDDGTTEEWIGPYASGQQITVSHDWPMEGTFTIKARAKDTDNLWGPWGELEIEMPVNQQSTNSLFLRFLEKFPLLGGIISRITNPLR